MMIWLANDNHLGVFRTHLLAPFEESIGPHLSSYLELGWSGFIPAGLGRLVFFVDSERQRRLDGGTFHGGKLDHHGLLRNHDNAGFGAGLLAAFFRWAPWRRLRTATRRSAKAGEVESSLPEMGKLGSAGAVHPAPSHAFQDFCSFGRNFWGFLPQIFGCGSVGRSFRYFSWGALAVLYGEWGRQVLDEYWKLSGAFVGIAMIGILAAWLLRRWLAAKRAGAA